MTFEFKNLYDWYLIGLRCKNCLIILNGFIHDQFEEHTQTKIDEVLQGTLIP